MGMGMGMGDGGWGMGRGKRVSRKAREGAWSGAPWRGRPHRQRTARTETSLDMPGDVGDVGDRSQEDAHIGDGPGSHISASQRRPWPA